MTIPKAEEVVDRYQNEDITQKELAEEYDTTDVAISIILRSHRATDYEPRDDYPWRDKDTLRELYCDQQMTQKEIADKWDTSEVTIRKWMKRHGIEASTYIVSRDAEGKHTNKEWLKEKYVDEEMSAYEIAQEIEVSDSTIYNWLDYHGIETRGVGRKKK